MKINYRKIQNDKLNSIKERGIKPSILLHSCCGPCSSSVIDQLKDYFDITVYYFNPNIHPEEEYLHRKEEQKRLLSILNIPLIEGDYNTEEFFNIAKGLEDAPQKGQRCYNCYILRLTSTYNLAKDKGFDYFCTTLTVSPNVNEQMVNEIGIALEKQGDVKFLQSDFKKEDGYLNSVKLAKEYNLYRQDYCGCIYSFRNKESE